MEESVMPKTLPSELYRDINDNLQLSFKRDYKNIVEIYDFFWKLPPKMRSELV